MPRSSFLAELPDGPPEERTELGKRFTVLRAVGELLGGDDVVERSYLHDDAADVMGNRSRRKVIEPMPPTRSIAKLDKQIDRAGIGHPCRVAEASERRDVDSDWQMARLVVAHAPHPKSRAQLAESCGEPLEVGGVGGGNAVEVGRAPRGAVGSGRVPADEEKLDCVPVEHGEQSIRIEPNARIRYHGVRRWRGVR